MGYLSETSDWPDQIFQKELDTPVLGGSSGPSNTQANEIANRTQKIKTVLRDNSIYIEDSEFEYNGQNIIFTNDFYSSVNDGHWVYWNVSNSKFYTAIAGGGAAASVVGIADVTHGRVIIGGQVEMTTGVPNGTIIYLSSTSSGNVTTTDTGVPLGVKNFPNSMRITLDTYYATDPVAGSGGLRTLGTGSLQAAAGNDDRFIHSGDVVSDSSGITAIVNNKVTEVKQNLTNCTNWNFSTSRHGYVPKGNDYGKFLKDNGDWDYVPNITDWVANDSRAKTALNASGNPPIYACRAWVNFRGSDVLIRNSGNISSVSKSSTGKYVINFITPMPNNNYSVSAWASGRNDINWGNYVSSRVHDDTFTTTQLGIFVRNDGEDAYNANTICVQIFI